MTSPMLQLNWRSPDLGRAQGSRGSEILDSWRMVLAVRVLAHRAASAGRPRRSEARRVRAIPPSDGICKHSTGSAGVSGRVLWARLPIVSSCRRRPRQVPQRDAFLNPRISPGSSSASFFLAFSKAILSVLNLCCFTTITAKR